MSQKSFKMIGICDTKILVSATP